MTYDKKRLFEVFERVNRIKLNEQISPNKKKQKIVETLNIGESGDRYETWDTYAEYHRDMLHKIIDEVNNGVEHEYWDLIEFPRLKKIWEDYMKLGFVRDVKGMENIKWRCIENIARLEVNTELVGHSQVHPEDLIAEEGYCFKVPGTDGNEEEFHDPNQLSLDLGHLTPTQPKETKIDDCYNSLNFTHDEFFERLDDYIGDDTFSDYATDPLVRLAFDLIEAKEPEQQLLICDQILNVVHRRGDIAALFVQGGSGALSQLSGEPAEKQQMAELYNKFVIENSKRKLLEMNRKINGVILNEQILPREEKNQIIVEFVKFVNDKYNFGNKIPNITISYKDGEAEEQKSFGQFIPQNKTIKVIATNRNLADVLRSLAHELVHYKQLLEGKINSESGTTGSNEENEANAEAGVLLREFGRTNPVIFE